MALFEALTIHAHGVSSYHINRYRLYFRPRTAGQLPAGHAQGLPPERVAIQLAQQFTANFPSFFNPNKANVTLRDEKWNNEKTLRFHLEAKALVAMVTIDGGAFAEEYILRY